MDKQDKPIKKKPTKKAPKLVIKGTVEDVLKASFANPLKK
jgi:hypothetical protein